MWACPFGRVPGNNPTIPHPETREAVPLNKNMSVVEARGKAIAKMAYDIAKDGGLEYAFIL